MTIVPHREANEKEASEREAGRPNEFVKISPKNAIHFLSK
jgi:hypothetical protein